jgi:hypothetical protein
MEIACGPAVNSLNVRGEIKSQVTQMGIRIKKRKRMTPKNQNPGHDRFACLVSSSTIIRSAWPGPGADPQRMSFVSNIGADSWAELRLLSFQSLDVRTKS